MMDQEFKIKSVSLIIQKMFDSHRFSICDIDNCLKISRIIPNKDVYNTLNALHCVHWSTMDGDMRKTVMKETLKMFQITDAEEYALRNFSRKEEVSQTLNLLENSGSNKKKFLGII